MAAKKTQRVQMTETDKPGEQVALGDSVELGNAYLQLPDGSVVTVRKDYVVRHEGVHRVGDRTFVGVKKEDDSDV